MNLITVTIHRARQPSRLTPHQRRQIRQQVITQLLLGELSQGQALQILRMEVLGIKQADYTQAVGVSRKTLSDIENDKGNYSVELLNLVFKPLGLEMGLVPIAKTFLKELIQQVDD